jgi:excisionase family DNA binding protein
VADTFLTLHEAAAELGVHYMTAYRYVRLGQLPAEKQGGSWRVTRDDLDTFIVNAAATPPTSDTGSGRRRVQWSERLEARLLAGDARGAWGVLESALAAGTELEAIYLEVLAPAMASIGDRWERGELDVSVEHRATGIAMRLMGRLGPRFVRRGRTRGMVVLAAPAGERHALPVAILADLVRLRGWEVSDLGCDLPGSSLLHAVLTTPDVSAIGLSVTMDAALQPAAEAFALLRSSTSDVVLVVGGGAVVDEEHARALGADALARTAEEFVAAVERHVSRMADEDGMAG